MRMLRRFAVAVALMFVSAAAFAATQGGTMPVPVPLFPPNNWWNTDISNAPVDANSASFITFIVPTIGLRPDFGGNDGVSGDVFGFPFIIVDGSQPKLTV